MPKKFLKILSKEDALREVLSFCQPIGVETIPVREGAGRVTAEPVFAERSNPPFLCSAVDGYAVSFEKTVTADVRSPILIPYDDCQRINTGERLRQGFDAVFMIEDVEERQEGIIVRRALSLWENVRMLGEDVIEGELLLPPNHQITPFDLGLLLAGGVKYVRVKKRPRALFVPTGKELSDPYDADALAMPEFNSYVALSLLSEWGVLAEKSEIATTREDLMRIIEERLGAYDLFLINAGTSAGTEDFTASVVEEMGRVIFHGVNMMPGKPFLFGIIRQRPVFGLPGYPASSILALKTFVLPWLERVTGLRQYKRYLEVLAGVKLPSRLGVEEVIRVNLIERVGKFYAFPLPRGASLISSICRADGLVRIPDCVEGVEEGEKVSCELLKSEEEIRRRINIIGSHDLSLDLLRSLIRQKDPSLDLLSIHTGSLSGLMAVKGGISPLCTIHILDEAEGVYNLPIVKRVMADIPCLVVHIAKRKQGLIVARGNPKEIRGLEDLKRQDVRFLNRQKGSGTRILLDYLLRSKGIDPSCIKGYEREETSHTSLALLVKEGVADCGLGIMAAAKAFALDFVPFSEEDFDLLVRKDFSKDDRFGMIIHVLSSREFKDALEGLGGYDTTETGTIRYANR